MNQEEQTAKENLANQLEAGKCNMFAERADTNDALEYAHQLAEAEGMPTGVMTVAIMVYHNTLISQLQRGLRDAQRS